MSSVPFANTSNIRALDLYNFFGGVSSFPIDQYYRGHIHNSLGRACIPNITENNTSGNVMPAGGQISYSNFSGKFADGGSQSFTLTVQQSPNISTYYGYNSQSGGGFPTIGNFGAINNGAGQDYYITGLGSVSIRGLVMNSNDNVIRMAISSSVPSHTWKQAAWRIDAPGVNGGPDDFLQHTDLFDYVDCRTKAYSGVWGTGNRTVSISWLR